MNIEYSNTKMEILFSDLYNVSKSKNLLKKEIGIDLVKVIKKRLNQIYAATTFKMYLNLHVGNPHSLTGDFKQYYGVDLNKHVRLIIQPVPADQSAEALANCEITKIIGVVDYHGDKNEWLIH